MLKTLDQTSSEELRSLVDFARALTVKKQEVADAAETVALQKAGQGFIAVDRPTRDWAQVVGYVPVGSTTVETLRGATWVHRPTGSPAAQMAVDTSVSLWEKSVLGNWLNNASGQTRTATDPTWRLFSAPAGDCWVDPVGARSLLPVLVWLDRTTGTTSALGPGSGDFVGETSNGLAHPDGLSDIIAAPQEYVTALVQKALGGMTAQQEAALDAAIASFEEPGPWEDVRQPYFASDGRGNPILDDNGVPAVNPLRVVQVAFRGELNDYYRTIVRDSGISPYVSRNANQFEVIAWKAVPGMTYDDSRRFVAAHTESVRVYKAAFYNEAMEGDPLYFDYCRMFIAWMTINRISDERMDGIGDVDRMSPYDLTNHLYSFGIYQFDDLPIVYRRRLAKSIQKIISVKGTTQVFRDILGLFNLDRDLKIWKHYLVRYFPDTSQILTFPRQAGEGEELHVDMQDQTSLAAATVELLGAQLVALAGPYRSFTASSDGLTLILNRAQGGAGGVSAVSIVETEGGAVVEEGDISTGGTDYGLPEVGFQKVDIDDPAAETTVANLDTSFLADYDEFVSADPTWETTRPDARKLAFSVLQTKYFSMSSAVDTVYNGLSLGVLWGMLKDAQIRGRAGPMLIQGASSLSGVISMNLFEAFVATMTLTLWRFGVDDIIPHGEAGVSRIIAARTDGSAFPNEASLLPYSTVLERVATLPEPLTPQSVATASDNNVATAQRIDVSIDRTGHFADAVGDYDPLRGGEEIRTVPRNEALRRMWDYKFVSDYQTDAFGQLDTYSEWLGEFNPELAAWIKQIDADEDYVNGILSLILLIEDSIESATLNLPAAMGMTDIVMMYAQRLILFFKAYTTDLRSFSTFMLIDRPATETVRLMNLLAGMKATWSRDDALDQMKDLYSMIARWSYDEGSPESLLSDALAIFARLQQQDIAEILDLAKLRARDEVNDPAAVMRDAFAITTSFARRDAVTVHTRAQRAGDVVVTGTEPDEDGLFLPFISPETNPDLTPGEISDEDSSGLESVVVTPYTRQEPLEKPRTQGLGEGVRITID
jgi:hypothetical protein